MQNAIDIYKKYKDSKIDEDEFIKLPIRNCNYKIKKFLYIILKRERYICKKINDSIYKIDNGMKNQSFYINIITGKIINNEQALFYLKRNKEEKLPNKKTLNRFYNAFYIDDYTTNSSLMDKKQINKFLKSYNLIYSQKMHCLLNVKNYAKNNNYNKILELLIEIEDNIKDGSYSIRFLDKGNEKILMVCTKQKIYIYFISNNGKYIERKEFKNRSETLDVDINKRKIIFDNGIFDLYTKEEICLNEPVFSVKDYSFNAEKFYLLVDDELLFFDLMEPRKDMIVHRFRKNYKFCINYDLNSVLINGKEYYIELNNRKYKDIVKLLKSENMIEKLEKKTKMIKVYNKI